MPGATGDAAGRRGVGPYDANPRFRLQGRILSARRSPIHIFQALSTKHCGEAAVLLKTEI